MWIKYKLTVRRFALISKRYSTGGQDFPPLTSLIIPLLKLTANSNIYPREIMETIQPQLKIITLLWIIL